MPTGGSVGSRFQLGQMLYGRMIDIRKGEDGEAQCQWVPLVAASKYGRPFTLLWQTVEYARGKVTQEYARIAHACALGQLAGMSVRAMALRSLLPMSAINVLYDFVAPCVFAPESLAPFDYGPVDDGRAWRCIAVWENLCVGLEAELRAASELDRYIALRHAYVSTSLATLRWVADEGLYVGCNDPDGVSSDCSPDGSVDEFLLYNGIAR